jgi:hypothetical protein
LSYYMLVFSEEFQLYHAIAVIFIG